MTIIETVPERLQSGLERRALRRARRRMASTTGLRSRPKVLHLALEDIERPGSGGGALRTYEMSRRLAADFEIEVVTARYRGARDRVEDGVRYRHVGLGLGYLTSMATYHLVLPWVVHRSDADLVIDEFSSPIGSPLIPLFARAPTVGLIQWLFARQMSRKYRLPFWLIESASLRLHHTFVVTSEDLATELRRRAPRARVVIVPNGTDLAGLAPTAPTVPGSVVFLGRLDIDQKGIDLLLDAWTIVHACHPSARLVLAGDGHDEGRVQALVAAHPAVASIELRGRVAGAAKHRLLAGAQVVSMPSRYETFGIVAIEALASGSPVVAFDIDSLRAVVPSSSGHLVPAFDVAAYADALVALLDDPERCATMGRAGMAFAAGYDWDVLCRRQHEVLVDALAPAVGR